VTCDKFWFIDLLTHFKSLSSCHSKPAFEIIPYISFLNNILADFSPLNESSQWPLGSKTRLSNILYTSTFEDASLNDAKHINSVLTSMKPNTIGSARSHNRMSCVSILCWCFVITFVAWQPLFTVCFYFIKILKCIFLKNSNFDFK